jgi:hypothetical protein
VEYGGSVLVAGALDTCCWRIHLAKPAALITTPVLCMCPCQSPHSSAQRISNAPVCRGRTNATLSVPGIASAFTPSWIAQNEWFTSSEVTWISVVCPSGIASSAVSTPP